MAFPGTGSSNQTLTFAASKKVYGKAHTSNQREIYNESILSNVQMNTTTMFAQSIPRSPITSSKTGDNTFQASELYNSFSASDGGPVTVEFVEFYVANIALTDYDANTGSFGSIPFGGGDEDTPVGFHGYQLVLTSSYQTLSSGSWAGTGSFVNNKVVHETNGGLQLVSPFFGSQAANQYELEMYTAHPDNGGLKIAKSSPAEILVDYFNGTLFVQDFISGEIPTYARGFIYVGKFADEMITEASSSGGGGSNITVKDEGSNLSTAAVSFDFVGSGVTATKPSGQNIRVTIPGGIIYSRDTVASTITASVTSSILGVSGTTAIDIRLPSAGDYTSGQFFTIKDESGAADSKNITIKTSGSQTIDGELSIVLESPFAAINLYSNGSDKFFIY